MSNWREEMAAVLEGVAKDGMPHPRDLDVALDAIEAAVADALAQARREGMEEAAKVAEWNWNTPPTEIAAAIRAKAKEPTT